jgi:hypothetical protein
MQINMIIKGASVAQCIAVMNAHAALMVDDGTHGARNTNRIFLNARRYFPNRIF